MTIASCGRLVLVATPIGNLGDFSTRAIETLRLADWIYAEDTRHSRVLFNAHGINSAGKVRSLHAHNEAERAAEIVELLLGGANVAYVSDAGTPGISDPGERLVRVCVAAGARVDVVPGPSAVVAALAVSGLPTTPFVFLGFLERKGGERREQLRAVGVSRMTTVFFEAPKRIVATLSELDEYCGGERPMAIARELTKLYEQVVRGTISEVRAAFVRDEIPERGEYVVVVGPGSETLRVGRTATPEVVDAEIDELLRDGLRVRDIADALSARHGVPRRAAYERVLTRAKLK